MLFFQRYVTSFLPLCISVYPVCLHMSLQTVAEVFGLQAYASVNGFIYFVRGLGTMLGSPVGGKILGESKLGNYRSVILFDAALLSGATFCVIAVRFFDSVEKRSWKWIA